jgi:hypothetical protein
LGSSLIDAQAEGLKIPQGVSAAQKLEDEELVGDDKATYEKLKEMANSDPEKSAAIEAAIKENKELFGSKISNDILAGVNEAAEAFDKISTDPNALQDPATKTILDHIVEDDTIYADVQRIETGLEKLLIPDNEDNPEYDIIKDDYSKLSALDEELENERLQLKNDLATGAKPYKILDDLRLIGLTEEKINKLKNKTELDVATFYYYQSHKTKKPKHAITISKFITILRGKTT